MKGREHLESSHKRSERLRTSTSGRLAGQVQLVLLEKELQGKTLFIKTKTAGNLAQNTQLISSYTLLVDGRVTKRDSHKFNVRECAESRMKFKYEARPGFGLNKS